MAWVKVRIEGEQQGRILAAFALLGIPKQQVKFYQKDRGEAGWLGYASLQVNPPANKTAAPASTDTALFDPPRRAEPQGPPPRQQPAPRKEVADLMEELPMSRPIIHRPAIVDEFPVDEDEFPADEWVED